MTPLEELLRSTLHDPARELPPPPNSINEALRGVGRLRRRRRTLMAAVAACTAGVIAAGVVVADVGERNRGTPAGSDGRSTPAATGIPDAEVVRRISIPLDSVVGLAMDAQAVYAFGSALPGGFRVIRVERSSGDVVRQTTLRDEPKALAVGPAGTLWVATRGDQPSFALVQLDRRTLAVRRTVRLVDPPPVALAVSGSTLWAAARSTLYQLEPESGRVLRDLHLGRPTNALYAGSASRLLYVQLLEERTTTVVVLDGLTGSELTRRTLRGELVAIGGSVWTASSADVVSTDIRRLDPRTLADREPGEVGRLHDRGLAVWSGAPVLWITDARRASLTCVEPVSGDVLGVRRLATGQVVADAQALYAVTGEGLVQVAPASVCRR